MVTLQQLRYRFDDPEVFGLKPVNRTSDESIRSRGLAQNLRVSQGVLPQLQVAVDGARAALGVTDPLTVFVYPSAELNALCHSASGGQHILVFVSSGLITHLSPAEWRCIIGHELGHHALGHGTYPKSPPEAQHLRELELGRAAEISADRAGLIACNDVDVALRAMLKVGSGLDESHLQVDIADYMRQLAELRETAGDEGVFFSTHPPFPVRVRALLRFDSLLREARSGSDYSALLCQTDDSIQHDMDAASGASGENRFTEQGCTAAFWAAALSVCEDGRFTTDEQRLMTERFGPDRVDALKRLLDGADSMAAGIQLLQEKTARTREGLATAPLLAVRRFEALMTSFR